MAIIGAGGIGFDVADFLSVPQNDDRSAEAFLADWGVDTGLDTLGGLSADGPSLTPGPRQITLLQRKPGKPGKTLGLTTGWAVVKRLKRRGVKMLAGVTYERIDDEGLHIALEATAMVIPADTVIICAGQESRNTLYDELDALGLTAHLIGGAAQASELDALGAISQGYGLALKL